MAYPFLAIALGLLIYWVIFLAPLRSRQGALSTCGECGGVVDDDATECRHCGAPCE